MKLQTVERLAETLERMLQSYDLGFVVTVAHPLAVARTALAAYEKEKEQADARP